MSFLKILDKKSYDKYKKFLLIFDIIIQNKKDNMLLTGCDIKKAYQSFITGNYIGSSIHIIEELNLIFSNVPELCIHNEKYRNVILNDINGKIYIFNTKIIPLWISEYFDYNSINTNININKSIKKKNYIIDDDEEDEDNENHIFLQLKKIFKKLI